MNEVRVKNCLLMFIVLMLVASLAMVSVPVQSSPSPVTFEVEMPPEGYITGVPAGTTFTVNVSVDASELTPDTSAGMITWGFDVQVDPNVLEIVGAFSGNTTHYDGYYLWDFLVDNLYVFPPIFPYEPTMLYTSYPASGYMDDVTSAIVPPTSKGAGGTHPRMCILIFKSKSEHAYSPINISIYQSNVWQAVYRNGTGGDNDAAVIDGHYNPPWLYLHSESGLIDLTSPETTSWQGLYPPANYSHNYDLIEHSDTDLDSNLSSSDKIKLDPTTPSGSDVWYQVRNVTVTLNTKLKDEATTTRNSSYTSGDWNNGTDAYADGGGNAYVKSPGGPYLWISGNDDQVRKVEADYPETEVLSWDTTKSRPYGLEFRTVSGNDYIYVVDYANSSLTRHDADTGLNPTTWDMSGVSGAPYGLAWNGSKWFIADRTASRIYGADWGDTSPDMSFNYIGIGAVEGIACNGTYMWAVDDATDYAYKFVIPDSGFDVEVSPITSWDIVAANNPVGIAYDSTLDRLWIVSSASDALYKFNATGDLEGTYDPPGAEPEGVAYQQGVDVPKRQYYGEFGFDIYNLPDSATDIKVNVRLDAWTTVNDNITLKVSATGNATWFFTEWTKALTGTEATYWANVTNWTSWTPAMINNDTIWIQVRPTTVGGVDDVYLDYVSINVTYIAYYYIEFRGDIQDFPWTDPEGTKWHEIYPLITYYYNLTSWTDGANLTVGDEINLNNTLTGTIVTHRVENMSTDIVLEGPIPPPVVVPEFPLGVALEIGLIVAIAYVWWRRRRKTKITRQKKPGLVSPPASQ